MAMEAIQTLDEARKLTYGFQWNRKTYQEGRCCERVIPNERGAPSHQCRQKNGHGPAGLYCKRHDPVRVKAKQTERYKQWEDERTEDRKRRTIQDAAPDMLTLLREIADHCYTAQDADRYRAFAKTLIEKHKL